MLTFRFAIFDLPRLLLDFGITTNSDRGRVSRRCFLVTYSHDVTIYHLNPIGVLEHIFSLLFASWNAYGYTSPSSFENGRRGEAEHISGRPRLEKKYRVYCLVIILSLKIDSFQKMKHFLVPLVHCDLKVRIGFPPNFACNMRAWLWRVSTFRAHALPKPPI